VCVFACHLSSTTSHYYYWCFYRCKLLILCGFQLMQFHYEFMFVWQLAQMFVLLLVLLLPYIQSDAVALNYAMDLPPPVQPHEPLQPEPSGHKKRRCRNKLPECFLISAPSDTSQRALHGLMNLAAVGTFRENADTVSQLLNLIAHGSSLDHSHFVSWHVESLHLFDEGPMDVKSSDFRYHGLVTSGLSLACREVVWGKHVTYAGQHVLVRELLGKDSLRVFSVPSRAILDSAGEHLPFALVTVKAQCVAAGVAYPTHHLDILAGPITPVAEFRPSDSDDDHASEDEVLETGPRRVAYPASVTFCALRLSALLKNQTTMVDAVQAALSICLPTDEASRISADIESGVVPVPRAHSLNHSWHKLDVATLLWERECHSLNTYARCLSADSSPKSWNFLCVREDRFVFPHTCFDLDKTISSRVLEGAYESIGWPVTVLGHGASNIAYKFRNLLHGIALKCKNEQQFKAFRESVVGFTTDQGTERKLADCALAVDTTFDNVAQVCDDLVAGTLLLTSDVAQNIYVFPYCLFVPGHMHILFNALEESVKKSKIWGERFVDALRNLLHLLNDRGLRQRMIATCFQTASVIHSRAVHSFSAQHLDWRWESLGKLLDALVPVVPIVIKYWDGKAMTAGSTGEGTIALAVVGSVTQFLKSPYLMPCLEALRLVAHTLNEWGSWLEGCPCHEHIWTADGSWAHKQKLLWEQHGIRQCPCKGKRGPEMAAFAVDRWLDKLQNASSEDLTSMLSKLDDTSRGHVAFILQEVRDFLGEVFSAKMFMWKHLPYLIVGMNVCDSSSAKAVARQCLSEWESCDQRKAHRVAHRFFADPVVLEQIKAFASSLLPVSEYPRLHNLLQLYSSVSLVERAIEGEHAKIQWVEKMKADSPATICSRMRSTYLLSLLATPLFRAWATSIWNSHVFRSVLQVLYSPAHMRGWGRVDCLKHIYMFGLDQQFTDTSQIQLALKNWDATLQSIVRPIKLAITTSQTLAIEWLRSRLTLGRCFCTSSNHFRTIGYVNRLPGHDPGAAESSINDVLALLDCDDLAANGSSMEDLCFFRVLNPTPTVRVLQHPHHLGGKSVVMAVVQLHLKNVSGTDMLLYGKDVLLLDVCGMTGSDFPSLLKHLWSYDVKLGTVLTLLPHVSQQLSQRLQISNGEQPPLSDTGNPVALAGNHIADMHSARAAASEMLVELFYLRSRSHGEVQATFLVVIVLHVLGVCVVNIQKQCALMHQPHIHTHSLLVSHQTPPLY
jgi:hypothetical protein